MFEMHFEIHDKDEVQAISLKPNTMKRKGGLGKP
jgi:hypothetical protein